MSSKLCECMQLARHNSGTPAVSVPALSGHSRCGRLPLRMRLWLLSMRVVSKSGYFGGPLLLLCICRVLGALTGI